MNGMLRECTARGRSAEQRGNASRSFAQSLGADIAGAIGEAAVAKALDFYWFCGRAGDPDVGGVYEVRTTEQAEPHLALYEWDDPRSTFIAVKIFGKESGCECEILGWLDGREGMEEKYRRKGPIHFYIPPSSLRPFSALEAGNRMARAVT